MRRSKRRGTLTTRILGYASVILASAFLTAPHVLAAAFYVKMAMGG